MQPIIPVTIPRRVFQDHENRISSVAVFHDERRMVTGSYDKTLCLWDLKDGTMLKKIEGHHAGVQALAVSRNGKFIASGDVNGELIGWDGDSGEPLTQIIKAHNSNIITADFSPDSAAMATVSYDETMKLWRTDTWQIQHNINFGEAVECARYSPSGELLAIATQKYIQIWNARASKCIAKFTAPQLHRSLAWKLDGTRLFSGGCHSNATIQEWDTLAWKEVGDPWSGHTNKITALAVNSTGTLVASTSYDSNVRLWRVSDGQTIAIFHHLNDPPYYVTFSADSKYIFSGAGPMHVSEWCVPEGAFPEGTPEEQVSDVISRCEIKLRKKQWMEALDDAQKVHLIYQFITVRTRANSDDTYQVAILEPSSYLGYHFKYKALHGAQRYCEAIEVLHFMMSKVNNLPDPKMRSK